jgi:hypothetical protein
MAFCVDGEKLAPLFFVRSLDADARASRSARVSTCLRTPDTANKIGARCAQENNL